MISRVMLIDLIQRLLSKTLRSFNWAPVRQMFGCKCFTWTRVPDLIQPGPDRFSLPSPIPQWPEGTGFSTGIIDIGELEVFQIAKFDFIWGERGVSFYKPISIPDGFSCLGHYCQSNNKPLKGFVLVARGLDSSVSNYSPPLSSPVDYSLIWISEDGNFDNCGFFWLSQPPEGYKALGFVVTCKSEKPDLEEVKCVRSDLTDACETHRTILETHSKLSNVPLRVFNTRPVHRGIHGRGISVGTFHCSSGDETRSITCLKNSNTNLHSMPSLDQVHALITHYGPTLFFHPDEIYLPSSVSWFFRNGALLYSKREAIGHAIDPKGSNLPIGGTNDGMYWIDLPVETERASFVKQGNLESAKLYAHVKPALGGLFTDIAMWVFCPFNGPGILKIGPMDIALSKVGRHVGDWEHFTLRISNFSGELYSVYFSQHSGGEWVESCDLDFVEGNKAAVYSSRNGHASFPRPGAHVQGSERVGVGVVYSSRNGHASFPRPGAHVQGSERVGVGVRNDAVRSDDKFVESSRRYEIVAAEYLGDVVEPGWLGYMGAWGPKVVYESRVELDRVVKILPAVENILGRLPVELYGEEGPTGPKAKNNWVGDEKW